MDPWQAVSQLGPLIIQRAEEHGFKLLSPFAERHGSWELDLYRKDVRLDRYVFVAFTIGIKFPTINRNSFDVEFWTGADDGSRCTRHLVSKFAVTEDQFTTPEFQASVKKGLQEALRFANRIAPEDLNEPFALRFAATAKGKGA